MILSALAQYYERLALSADGEIAKEGFERKEIPFIVKIDNKGGFKGIIDTREGEGRQRRARLFTIPKAVKRTLGINANILWDNPTYVFGVPKSDKNKDQEKEQERAKELKKSFSEKVKWLYVESNDEDLKCVIEFLKSKNWKEIKKHPLWKELIESGSNVTFQMDGKRKLICENKAVIKAIIKSNSADSIKENEKICLVTGKKDQPVKLHTSIKGVWGAQSSGANIVSFNLDAFTSFAKDQGFNAPVGKKAEFAYTTALNTLLSKDSKQRIQVGDASTVFWSEKETEMEKTFLDCFNMAAGEEDDSAAMIKRLFESPKKGTPAFQKDFTPFYVLGLSPNASRIAIRFWYVGTVSEVADHIRQHFDDLKIVRAPHDQEYIKLFKLLVSIAVLGKADNIPPNLAGELMMKILKGTPYPQVLLMSVINRIKAERKVDYVRAALIKAVLVRNARYSKQKEREVGEMLDRSLPNIGYRLGRLFAVLERIQETANPGINATIRDRYFSAASSTPVSVFPTLLRLKNHHTGKLEHKGQVVNFEKEIGQIMESIQDIPTHLTIQDQARFSVGYYHQHQNFYTKKENKIIEEAE